MRPPRCSITMSRFIAYLPLFHFALEAHSVIEKGRRLVNEKILRIVGCVQYRDGIKSTGDKTGMVVGAMKCIGG